MHHRIAASGFWLFIGIRQAGRTRKQRDADRDSRFTFHVLLRMRTASAVRHGASMELITAIAFSLNEARPK
jgi:hypothetical protein